MAKIDLNQLANNPKLSLSITSTQDENPIDTRIRHFKEITLFTLTILLILCVFSFCVYLLITPRANSEDKKWAMTIAGSIISALLGYVTGRKLN